MKKSIMILVLALALAAGACAQDVTASEEYQALEADLADARSQLNEATAENDRTVGEPESASPRHDRALAILAEIKQILDDPDAFGTEEEIAALLSSHATETALMDDDVFGAMSYKQGFYYTLFGGTTDARIKVHDVWVSDDGSQGGILWVWSGTNAAGNPFELPGISLTEFAEDGRIAYELVTYPYSDDYVREAFRGDGTPTPSTD